MNGKIVPLTEVPDEAFSGELLGKGCAIEPTSGKVVAPCDGQIVTLFPTKHAIGIVSKENAEILIHLGIDTVKLEGEGFKAHVKQGDKVKKGQLLVSVDLDKVRNEGYSMISPIIITNTVNYTDVVTVQKENVQTGDELLTLVK